MVERREPSDTRALRGSRTDSLRALLIAPLFRGGGGERCPRELLERLPGLGVEPTMFVGVRRPEDPPAVHGVRLPGEKYLRALDWLGRRLDWRHLGSRLVLDRVRIGEYDVIHAHNLHGGWMSLGAVRRLAERIPLVWTLHDEWALTGGLSYDVSRFVAREDIDRRFGRRVALHPVHPAAVSMRAFLQPLMPAPTVLVCPSRYLAELARSHPAFPSVPVERIPYGVALLEREENRMSRAEARRSFGIREDERVVLLAAANLDSPYKGAALAVEALRQLDAPGVRLLIVSRNAHLVADRVPLPVLSPGFLADDAAMARAYRAADVTLVPSVADNYPYVALESLACETPVVAFRVGGLTEIVGGNERGMLAAPFDTAELARNLRRLLEDEALVARLGRAGHDWVSRTCSMGEFLAATRRVYEQAIAIGRVRPNRAYDAGPTGSAAAHVRSSH